MKVYPVFILLILLHGCDHFSPKSSFILAVPENDHSYNISAKHLVSFLEEGGFKVEILPAKNAIDANHLVASGEADLTFIMNHSKFIPEKLGRQAGKLRTICPMYQRLLFLFSENPLADSLNTRELLEGKVIGIEVLNGETHANLNSLFSSGKIDNVSIMD